MKKKVVKVSSSDNSFGVASVVLGIVSFLTNPFSGIILGILALVFANNQRKIYPNKWSRSGRILGIIGIVLGAITLILLVTGLTSSPELFGNVGGGY